MNQLLNNIVNNNIGVLTISSFLLAIFGCYVGLFPPIFVTRYRKKKAISKIDSIEKYSNYIMSMRRDVFVFYKEIIYRMLSCFVLFFWILLMALSLPIGSIDDEHRITYSVSFTHFIISSILSFIAGYLCVSVLKICMYTANYEKLITERARGIMQHAGYDRDYIENELKRRNLINHQLRDINDPRAK
jgi:hypothetical protein